MRIAVITNSYPPDQRGGAGRIAELKVEGLRKLGHEVKVWHGSLKWTKRGVVVRLLNHVLDLVSIPAWIQEIIEYHPEVVLTHNVTGCGFRMPHQLQSLGIPWAHILHDVQLFEPSGQLVDARPVTLWQRAWSVLRRKSLHDPDTVISPTKWLHDEHVRRGFFSRSRFVCLPNPAPEQKIIRRSIHDPLRLLFVGRFSKDKGAEVVEKLADEPSRNYQIEVIGPSDRTHENIIFLGPLSPEDVLLAMEEADILLVPSIIEENQPTVILEAASRGLPVIASDKSGIKETLGDACVTTIAELSNPGTYQMYVKKMEALYQKHTLAKHLQGLVEVLETLKRKT